MRELRTLGSRVFYCDHIATTAITKQSFVILEDYPVGTTQVGAFTPMQEIDANGHITGTEIIEYPIRIDVKQANDFWGPLKHKKKA